MRLLFCLLLLIGVFESFAQVQWAAEVKEYSTQRGVKQFSANQILGSPKAFPQGAESYCAWSPEKEKNKKEEFIKVRFARPDFIKEVLIFENFNPGSISKVFVYSTSGTEYLVYENESPQKEGHTRVLKHVFKEVTKYKVRDVKVVLNTNKVSGYNCIDAIGIATKEIDFIPEVHLSESPIVAERENLGNAVNSEHFEFLPQISPDGTTLYFSRRDHPENTGSNKHDDIWFTKQENGKWQEARKMPAPINDEFPNTLFSVSPDGNLVLLGGEYKKGFSPEPGVSTSINLGGGWSYPKSMKVEDFYNNGAYNEFFMSTNRHILLMTLDRTEGYGDNDIYVSFLKIDKTWTKPKNISAVINTAGVEASPFLAADNKTMYFSSNGYPGYGKQDLYVTHRLDETWENWTEPINLGAKINTNENESYYSIPASGEYAYFVSTKKTLGASDVFRIKLPESIKPAPVTYIHGDVEITSTHELVEDVEIYYELLPEGMLTGSAKVSTSSHEYAITLPRQHTYAIWAEKEDYLSELEIVEKKVDGEYVEKVIHLKLHPIEVGERVVLRDIVFDQGKSDLLERSHAELDRLLHVMEVHPTLCIRLEGFTDPKGVNDWNVKLSQERVDHVKGYLVKNGIKNDRVETLGMGGKNPVAPGSSELNRRVELVVLKK